MNKLPAEVIDAWNSKQGPVVLTTVAPDGTPNSIYATCVSLYEEEKPVIADNYFDKTRANILDGSPASVLFISEAGKAYQLKGSISYEKEGKVFTDMKSWNPEKHPGHAATVVKVSEIFSGSEKIGFEA